MAARAAPKIAQRAARTEAGSELAWINARTFGVVVASV